MSDNIPQAYGRIHRRHVMPDGGPKSWWKSSRRQFIIGGAVGLVGLAGLGVWWAVHDDTTEVNEDALDMQRKHGWDIGAEEKKLTLPSQQTFDSQKRDDWNKYLDQNAMLAGLQPKSIAWTPYFVPTLIQSLQFESLKKQLTPIFTPDMDESYKRAQGIAKDILGNAKNPGETAIIVDVPGRDAVAFGAGMADAGHVVLGFDNFPHPLGVVHSHETLAALLYYAGEIQTKQSAVAPLAPPVFLLDSDRLATYKDEYEQFDNRFLAKLPTAAKLRENGVKSIIYVTPDRSRTTELDDLNEDFVDFKDKGLNVAMLPLSDLSPVDEQVAQKQPDGTTRTVTERHYYYGGSPFGHSYFFYHYPFYAPSPIYVTRYPGYATARPPASFAPPRYVPAPRPTMFAGTRVGGRTSGVGRSKPSGFGRTTVRMSPSGSVVGTRTGRSGYYSPSRSGSFGRGGGYSS